MSSIFEKMIPLFFKLQFILICINDYYLLRYPTPNWSGKNYLIGNKFSVIYAHVFLAVFYLLYLKVRGKKRSFYSVGILLFSVVTIFIGNKIGSGTSIIGVLLILFFLFFLRKENSVLYKPQVTISLFGLSAFFVFGYSIILRIPIVQYFITQLLGKTLLLSDRTLIYDKIPELLSGHYLLGYGYGTTYDVWMNSYGYQNSQNGVFEWVFQSGIIAIIFIVIIIWISMKNVKRIEFNKTIFAPIVAVVLFFCSMASIEITLSTHFFVFLAILYGMSNSAENTLLQNKKS